MGLNYSSEQEFLAAEYEAERQMARLLRNASLRQEMLADPCEQTHCSDAADYECDECGWPVNQCQCEWIEAGKEFLAAERRPVERVQMDLNFEREVA